LGRARRFGSWGLGLRRDLRARECCRFLTSALEVDGHGGILPLEVVAAMDDVVLFPLFLPLGQDTLRYLEDWRPSPLTHHWLGQQVSTFEVKSPFIDDFDFSKA